MAYQYGSVAGTINWHLLGQTELRVHLPKCFSFYVVSISTFKSLPFIFSFEVSDTDIRVALPLVIFVIIIIWFGVIDLKPIYVFF